MSKKPQSTKRPATITGHDQLCVMLLRTLDRRNSEADALHYLRYRDRARQILASKDAFDHHMNTLSVTDVVLRDGGLKCGIPELNRLADDIVNLDAEQVTARADYLRNVIYAAIDEAQLLGAALVFELLGGAR